MGMDMAENNELGLSTKSYDMKIETLVYGFDFKGIFKECQNIFWVFSYFWGTYFVLSILRENWAISSYWYIWVHSLPYGSYCMKITQNKIFE